MHSLVRTPLLSLETARKTGRRLARSKIKNKKKKGTGYQWRRALPWNTFVVAEGRCAWSPRQKAAPTARVGAGQKDRRDQRIQEGRPRALASPLNSQLGKVQLTAWQRTRRRGRGGGNLGGDVKRVREINFLGERGGWDRRDDRGKSFIRKMYDFSTLRVCVFYEIFYKYCLISLFSQLDIFFIGSLGAFKTGESDWNNFQIFLYNGNNEFSGVNVHESCLQYFYHASMRDTLLYCNEPSLHCVTKCKIKFTISRYGIY